MEKSAFLHVKSKVTEYRNKIRALGNRPNRSLATATKMNKTPSNCEGKSFNTIKEYDGDNSTVQNLFELNYSSKLLLTPISPRPCRHRSDNVVSTPLKIYPSFVVTSSSIITDGEYTIPDKRRSDRIHKMHSNISIAREKHPLYAITSSSTISDGDFQTPLPKEHSEEINRKLDRILKELQNIKSKIEKNNIN